MTVPPASELRFACPHCGQRIVCESAHAGHLMVCPTCQGGLQIPAVAQSEQTLSVKLRTSPAASEPLYPRPATVDAWTEEEWNEHVRGVERRNFKHLIRMPGFWISQAVLLAVLIQMVAAPDFIGTIEWFTQNDRLKLLAMVSAPVVLMVLLRRLGS